MTVSLYQNDTLINSTILSMNSRGLNEFSFAGLNAGNYTIKADFAGNNNYYSKDGIKEAIITKVTPVLNIVDIPDYFQYGDLHIANISLEGNNPLSENVTISILTPITVLL